MAVRTISTKLTLEGEQEYKSKMANVNNELKTLGSELKLVESEFKGNANSMEALTAKGDVLQKMYDAQDSKIKLVTDRLNVAKEAQKNAADIGDELADSIRAQKDIIAEYEQELKKSADGSVEFRDANGNLARSVKDGAGEVERMKNELKDMERALGSNQREQQSAGNTVNEFQRQANNAKVKLNGLNSEVQQNKRYMNEAEKSTDKTATSIDRFGKEAKDAAEKGGLLSKIFAGGFLANIATGAISVLTNTIKKLVSEIFTAADELKRLSDVTGLSTTKLQEMQYVGDDVGVSLDTITGALSRLTNAMDSASKGSGEAYEAFEKLGINIKGSDGYLRDRNEIFYEAIDALGKMTNATERDAIAQNLLGKSALELNPLIKEGAEGMKELASNAVIMSETTIKNFDAVGDAWDHISQNLVAGAANAFVGLSDVTMEIIGLGPLLDAKNFEDSQVAAFEAIDAMTDLADKNKQVQDSYDATFASAQASLESQATLWENLGDTANKTFGDIKLAIESQIRYYQDYSTNLANLSMRNVEGMDELVAQLSDGTKKSAAIAAGLITATDSQLKALIGSMDEVEMRRQALARQIANNATGQGVGHMTYNLVPNNVSINLDGQQLARATYQYNLEESSLRGNNLID